MTEWDAPAYARISALQAAMAEQSLAALTLRGTERVLDVGCGNGKITMQVAARVPMGSVVGVDVSARMVEDASSQCVARGNVRFEVADARELPFREEFDLVVSFNALHWVPEQDAALRSIRLALASGGRAELRLVPQGEQKSLESVLEDTRSSPRWSKYYAEFRDPYLRLTPDQYAALAERNGLTVRSLHTTSIDWDFGSREAFEAFGAVTFVEWTCRLPESAQAAFVADVLDRYRAVASADHMFRFYQMDVGLACDAESNRTKPR